MKLKMEKTFVTHDTVNGAIKDLNQGLTMGFVQKEEFMLVKGRQDDRVQEVVEISHGFKTALQNHTKHITSLKKDLEKKAPLTQMLDVVSKLKTFAYNKDFKALYDKVVPPLAEV